MGQMELWYFKNLRQERVAYLIVVTMLSLLVLLLLGATTLQGPIGASNRFTP